ncbi:hypothetical protein QUC31_016626, partial [Theobroma cacao]
MANKVAASLIMCLVLVAAVRLPTAAAQDAFSTTAKRNAKLVEEAKNFIISTLEQGILGGCMAGAVPEKRAPAAVTMMED